MNFKDKVYKFTQEIPKGRVATYKSVATAVGSPRTSRAVANVLAQNFNPKIPCHRVIKSDGSVGGYNRGGSVKKAQLLQDEGVGVKNNRIDLTRFSI
ncbi:MAG: MGMT family protein [Candidatus Sungbacteria bacterium]|uniref:MGMT family protein n=1 Tax=Candidatus Sungiibacteriota bacterium TaxID=2750080 RepID=A0A932DS12_9BACT|nr:MGMT family protein [Candidatus Sungbacteria bacterium]MBI2465615.1 MGMT family protein [Candidatus Sungbacteria bacterium]